MTAPPAPPRSNCLVWALCVKHLYGGTIRFRKSLNWPGPHWYVVLPSGEAWGYSPTRPLWPIPWDLLWFRGYVKPEGS